MSIQSEITRISGNVSDALEAIADKGVTVPSGSNSDDLADLISQISGGGGGTPVISVVDTTDTHGGTIRTITAVDISDTTATASVVQQGYYFYTAAGVKTAGTGSGGGGGGLTQHTIHLEFTDSSDADIEVDYDNALLATLITAYEPTGDWTYNNKTVDSAALDNVVWYQKQQYTWTTIYNSSSVVYYPEDVAPWTYCWISDLGDVVIPADSVWRITFDGNEYVVTSEWSASLNAYTIGNPKWSTAGAEDDGTNVPCAFHQTPWGAWSGGADVQANTDHSVKIERRDNS